MAHEGSGKVDPSSLGYPIAKGYTPEEVASLIEVLQSSGSAGMVIPGGSKGACDDTIEAYNRNAKIWQACNVGTIVANEMVR